MLKWLNIFASLKVSRQPQLPLTINNERSLNSKTDKDDKEMNIHDSLLNGHSLWTGIVLITLALCADAVIGNVQEKAMKSYGGSNTEMVNLYF